VIQVTRLNGNRLFVNADKILFVEPTPDTVISLLNGDKVPVRETPQQVVDLVVGYLRRIHVSVAEELVDPGRTAMVSLNEDR